MRFKSLAIVAALVLGLASSAFAGEKVTIKGSTTVLPIMQRAVEAFMKKHPDVTIEVSGGGSSNGIKALLDGTTDIAMASRQMKDKEMTLASEKGIKATEIVIAFDAVVPIVNPANPVANLTADQLKGIYEGKITNWKEVGGNDAPIVVISRDTSSGTYETWEGKIMKGARVFPGALLQASSGAVLQAVSKNPKAIAYDGLGYVNDSVHAVKVDGIAGSAESAKNNTYKIARSLQIYVNGEPAGPTKALVEFILSPEGQKIVEETGFIKM
jgi:phosphate transport system substrate-binding protein